MPSQESLRDGELDTVNLLEKPQWRHSPKRPWGSSGLRCYIFAFSLALNVLFVALLPMFLFRTDHSSSSYEGGFSTDLGSVKSEIRLATTRFSGGVELDHGGHFAVDPSGQQYVGEPSREVDRAWYNLLRGLNIDLTEDEFDAGTFHTFQWPESGLYFTGLEVFHSLHCLNRLRQALYPEYYRGVFSHPNDPSRLDHVGHCINQIRQALQCHADLTPMEWERKGNKVILNTATKHTCRDFGSIQRWVRQRETNFAAIKSVVNGSLFVVD